MALFCEAMKTEQPDSPAEQEEPKGDDQSRLAREKPGLEYFAAKFTLVIVVVVALIWFLVNEANKQDHDPATLLGKVYELLH